MTKEELKEVVESALEGRLKEFWVDRELHYKHHEFIDKWMKWSDDVSKTVWRSVVRYIVIFIMGLIALGFFWKHKQ